MDTDTTARLPHNVAGKFFTTGECDGCAYCASIAPENFDYDKSSNTYYVCCQPRTAEQEERVLEAAEDCPVDAIHIDGVVPAKMAH